MSEPTSSLIEAEALNEFRGQRLMEVSFVLDYVRLVFDKDFFDAFNPVEGRATDGSVASPDYS